MTRGAAPRVGYYHALKFYDQPESLHVVVAKYAGEALAQREPALLIVMPADRAGIVAELGKQYIDVNRAEAAGELVFLDAPELMARFMVDGMPDAELFITVATDALRQVLRDRTDCSVRAYGGMVSDLWKTGNVAAAIRLERLWNVLALTHSFSLFCGYSVGTYSGAAPGIVEEHTHVLPAQSAVWLATNETCPACGSAIDPDKTERRNDRVYRCQFCNVELMDRPDASMLAEPSVEAAHRDSH